jgi:hypothetical protein
MVLTEGPARCPVVECGLKMLHDGKIIGVHLTAPLVVQMHVVELLK